MYNTHLFGQATLAVSIPWYGAVSWIRPETDPLVARGTKNAIGFKLWDVGVGFEVVDALFFCAFSTSSFCRRVGQSLCCTFRGVNDGLSRGGSRGGWWRAFINGISDEDSEEWDEWSYQARRWASQCFIVNSLVASSRKAMPVPQTWQITRPASYSSSGGSSGRSFRLRVLK